MECLEKSRLSCHDPKYNYSDVVSEIVEDPYVSEQQASLTIDEVKGFLRDNNLLLNSNNMEDTRYWPGDKESQS